jgi:Protein of unknown function (DUF1553)/Protein of unknown function (DUF1549)/Planctomycete cytochrome C
LFLSLPFYLNLTRSMRTLVVQCLAIIALSQNAMQAVEKIEFNRDVRPILSDNCFYCHGPDKNHREADLRLDIREEAIDRAFVAGKPSESAMIERILSADADLVMPPQNSHKKLTTKQKETLKKWIEQGAEYQLHWSYEQPVKPSTPADQNAIDVLIEARRKSIGLKPSPEADRRTLIRRLSFDLLGLPPTPEEVSAFEKDPSPDAYARLVDRVLDNPHYGERMAIGWLDVVRFADTIGYHSDTPRNVWPYRDWVIKSFNDNKPFDQFTIEQLAGDLLPNANQDTRVASAFNRLLLTTEEGGAQPKDYEQRMVTDRVRAIGTTWLGQTTGCAQCHDHKFDPITMRDFYSLGAFFADIQEPIIGKREDGMLVATPEEEAKQAKLDKALEKAKKAYDAILPQLQTAQKQWEADLIAYEITLPELRAEAEASKDEIARAKNVVKSLAKTAKERKKPDLDLIQSYFFERGTKLYKSERESFESAKKARDEHFKSLTKCLVSVSSKDKRTVRILPRGNWMDETGEIVKPALPSYLPQPKIEGRELTRLDLAQWLVNSENPLTARTVMNRLWKQLFGSGLSKVLDDLGAQGEPPVNPALLDWLACEFVDSGWDVKHMVRAMVQSKAYRQSSAVTPDLLAVDPYNRELARQSAFRLEAELVRDQALSLSGLLVNKIGGPSVKPYQPDGYWENLNFPVRTYPTDSGEAQYRRGLYTWWQRSFLHPSMLAFDAPSREECCAERNRSNIPQQALVLLNDPTYVEAARVFAVRILAEAKGEDSEKIDWAWHQALQRKPTEKEKSLMLKLLAERREAYRANATSADELSKVGDKQVADSIDRLELAAWTHVTRVLLNLHETITRT